MAVRRPTLDQLRSVAEDLGMHMGDEELKSYDALMQANYAAYDAVDAMADYVPAVNIRARPAIDRRGRRTSTTLGMSRRRSRARRAASSPARRSL